MFKESVVFFTAQLIEGSNDVKKTDTEESFWLYRPVVVRNEQTFFWVKKVFEENLRISV